MEKFHQLCSLSHSRAVSRNHLAALVPSEFLLIFFQRAAAMSLRTVLISIQVSTDAFCEMMLCSKVYSCILEKFKVLLIYMEPLKLFIVIEFLLSTETPLSVQFHRFGDYLLTRLCSFTL